MIKKKTKVLTDEEVEKKRKEWEMPDMLKPEPQKPKTDNQRMMEGEVIVTKGKIDEKALLAEFNYCYNEIVEVLKDYVDIREEQYGLIALWILGTYIHKEFNTYPYLFINAMRGSGKTRLLKLICAMSHNGLMLGSLNETTLFRSSQDRTLCIDEFEGIGSKEKGNLRELLNAGYKKGMQVIRQKKGKEGGYEEEIFNVFTPIVMANIWGMEEVLSDRCISLIIEKSASKRHIKMIEDFEENPKIRNINITLSKILCSLCSMYTLKNIQQNWNNFVRGNYTNNTNNYINTNNTNYIQDAFLSNIDELDIDGRSLELFFPIIILQNMVNSENITTLLHTIKKMVDDKKEDDLTESLDVSFYQYIAENLWEQFQLRKDAFIPVAYITSGFRQYLDTNEDHINPRWVGRALKRLAIRTSHRRKTKGVEVIVNFKKAKKKAMMWKKEEK